MKKSHFDKAPQDIADLIRQNKLPTNQSPSEPLQITPELRVYVYTEGGKQKHKIQQAWINLNTDKVVWKDLPVVRED